MTKVKQAIMGAAILGLAVVVSIEAGATISPAEIAHMPWDEANISTLRSLDGDAIQKFVNSPEAQGVPAEGPLSSIGVEHVDQFAWADFEGKGHYALVDVYDTGNAAEGLSIFQHRAYGKIEKQEIKQDFDLETHASEGLLADAIRDLDGDGKKELLVYTGFGAGPSMADTPLTQWPLVYRLRNGQYIEASHEFPSFYDNEVLPPLEEQIAQLQKKLDSEVEAKAAGEAVIKEHSPYQPDIDSHTSSEQKNAVRDSERLALLQSLRMHIRRVLGRHSTPEEEKEALEWMDSPDYWVNKYAEQALEEMGGHRADAR